MGKVIRSDRSMESVWSARLTGLQVMVVWRPLVSRTVNLHTATMGFIVRVFSGTPAQVTPRVQIVVVSFLPVLRNPPPFAHQLASSRHYFLLPDGALRAAGTDEHTTFVRALLRRLLAIAVP